MRYSKGIAVCIGLVAITLAVSSSTINPSNGPAEQIANINQTAIPTGIDPDGFVRIGNSVVFIANDGIHGRELWITDGTKLGTSMLKDITPGPTSSYPTGFRVLDNGTLAVFFARNQLWRTDGTSGGTFKLADNIASGSSTVSSNSYVFFRSNDSSLWRTDGTLAGTIDLLADQPADVTDITQLRVFGETLTFTATTEAHGLEPWISDGTTSGTHMLSDLTPGTGSSWWNTRAVGLNDQYIFIYEGSNLFSYNIIEEKATDLSTKIWSTRTTMVNGVLYFNGRSASDSTNGYELWRSDGSDTGTYQVKDILSGSSSSHPEEFMVLEDKLVFTAYSTAGTQTGINTGLWVSDGTNAGTKLIYEFDDDYPSIYRLNIDYGGLAFFSYNSGFWRTDGTSAGTFRLEGLGAYPSSTLVVDNKLLMLNGNTATLTDGTNGGTETVLENSGIQYFHRGISLGSTILFDAHDIDKGGNLWTSDFPFTSAQRLTQNDSGPYDASSVVDSRIAVTGDKAYFFARTGDNIQGRQEELWHINLETLVAAKEKAVPESLTNQGYSLTAGIDALYFYGNLGLGDGLELLQYNLTSQQFEQVLDGCEGPCSGDPYLLGIQGNQPLLAIKAANNDIELWIGAGHNSTAEKLSTVAPSGSVPSNYRPGFVVVSPVQINNKTYFLAFGESYNQRQLWQTDGTIAGTKLAIAVEDINTLFANGVSRLYEVNNSIYLEADNALWEFNPNTQQVEQLFDYAELNISGTPYLVNAFGNSLIIAARIYGNNEYTTRIWKLQGTPLSAVVVGSYQSRHGSISGSVELGNDRFLFMEDLNGGGPRYRLWQFSNQAGATIQAITDVNIYRYNGIGSWWLQLDEIVIFSGQDTDSGAELWVSDGSQEGTRQIQDIYPGEPYGGPSHFIDAGDNIVFFATNKLGREPWAINKRHLFQYDYGDAPDPSYPSAYASDGARHRVSDLRLGTALDHESDALLDINNSATGDDLDNDDEDGVSFGDLAISANADITVVSSADGALLDAWIDFNRDGDWDDSGEQIFSSQALVAGDNELSIAIPTTVTSDGNSSTVTPGASFARFRISSEGGLATTGEAKDGEVEDYAVTILPPPNAKPTITAIADQQTDEDTAFSVSFTIADEEDDVSDLSLSYEFGTGDVVDNSSIGTLTVGNGGLRTLEISPLADKNGNQTITIKVTDTDSGFASTSFNLTVLPVNDKPVINDQNSLTTPEEQALTLALADFSTTDVDGDTLSLSVGTGSNYSVDGLTITPRVNFVGSLTVPVTVNDGELDSESFNASATVTNVNDAPTIAARSTLRTDEDTALELLLAHFSTNDVDGDSLTLQVGSGSNYSVNGTTITPAQDFSGTLTVPVTVNDGTVDSTVHNASVTVRPVNDAPTISGQQALNTDEDTALTLKLEDFNTNDVENQILTLIVMTGTNYSVNGLSITPAQDFNGTLSVPVKVRDIQGAESETFAARISVNAVNDKPLITGQKALSVNEDSSITLTLTDFTTSDVDGDSLTLKLLAGDGYSHSGLTVTPAADFNGKLSVNVVVNDGELDSETFAAEVTVTAVNDKPTVTAQAEPLSTNEDTALTLKLEDFTTNDIDNDPLTLKVQRGSNYSVSGLTITPANNFNGTLTVPVVVNDGEVDSAPFDASVTVTAVNDAPVINGQRPLSTNNQTPITLKRQHFDISDPDSDSDSEQFQLTVGLSDNYALEGNRVIPDSDFVGSLAVPVFVIDELGELSEVFTSEVRVLDSSSPHLSLTSNRQSAAEGQLIRLTAWLNQATDEAVAVSLSLTEGSQADADDITLPRQITLAPGSTQASVDIAVRNDSNNEGHERLEINPAVTAGSVTSALSLLTLTLHDANLVTHNNEPTAVDGDDDGNNDAEQSQVYSSTFVHRVTGNSNTTTAVSVFIPEADRHNGVVIDNAQIGDIDELMQPTQSSDSDFAANAISFDLRGLNPGGCADVHMLLGPVNSTPAYDRYYKLQYNARTGTQELLLFDYDEASQTGARFDTTVVNGVEQRRVTLSLCDGERGDYDNVANGIIEDPGVPAAAKASSTSTSTRPYGGGGSVSWHALFILALVLAVRRRWQGALHRSR